jgi:hypothetical protein
MGAAAARRTAAAAEGASDSPGGLRKGQSVVVVGPGRLGPPPPPPFYGPHTPTTNRPRSRFRRFPRLVAAHEKKGRRRRSSGSRKRAVVEADAGVGRLPLGAFEKSSYTPPPDLGSIQNPCAGSQQQPPNHFPPPRHAHGTGPLPLCPAAPRHRARLRPRAAPQRGAQVRAGPAGRVPHRVGGHGRGPLDDRVLLEDGRT